MAKYLLIESRDPFESRDAGPWYELAADLLAAGNDVTVFLVHNGVLAARSGARCAHFEQLLRTDVEVLADDFSLRERGIANDRIVAGVKPAPLDVVVDRLVDGCRALWH
jgi:sulfur relay (sulfurtransferase) complex TusBCD TusD component (DsrE family)